MFGGAEWSADQKELFDMTNTILGLVQRTALCGVLAGAALLGMAHGALALDHPNGLALDSAGNLYVANAGSVEQGDAGSVQVYSVAVKSTGVVGTLKGTITSNIHNPYSVAVSPFGTIYAGNLGGDTITVYGPNLAQTGTISDASITTYAMDMFVDGDGDLFALDAGGKVHVYLDNLAPVSTINVGGLATAITPWGSNVAVWGRNASGISTITANMGEAVHGSASINGNFPNGSLVPTGVAEDSMHQQYATNATMGQITVYSANFSTVMTTFNAYGSGIAIDPVRKLIYTSSPSSSMVFVYSLNKPYKFLGSF
jgi:sugar lactone lactonase YvrE